jgi:uncharacterized protein
MTTRTISPLGVDECLQLLGECYVGRLAFVLDGQPEIRPVNYIFHEGMVVFRMGLGRTVDHLAEGVPAVFEIDDVEPTYHEAWSVIVKGRTEEVWDPDELERYRELPLHPWAPGERLHYLRLLPSSISGRRIA